LALPLRVALDATPLSVPTGGIRRYTEELVRALARLYPDDTYYLVSDQAFEMPYQASNLLPGNPPATAADRRWWAVGLARELRRLSADVFHGTDFGVPYLPTRPAVMTIHDLSPWRAGTSEFTSRRIRRRTPILLKLGLATMVITPSEAIRREAITRFKLRSDRVVAIPLAASEAFRPVMPAARERPYFLCIGAPNPRKNLELVLDAGRQLRNKANVDVVVSNEVPDDDLPALYSGAIAFLYPSLYEGFGLPVLEAMQCGTMVIASKDPAVTEVAGGAAVQVDAGDERGWLAAMTAALSLENRAAWRERGLARAAAFSWEGTAMMTREVYDEARHID
jgi:glycosyltransferase involved in cell wall biosynthesis